MASRPQDVAALVLCAMFLVAGAPARAASGTGITVSPVRVDLAADARSSAITVSSEDAPRVIQVEAFRWQRTEGDGQLVPSTDLIVNPPLFRVEPGRSQIVRVGRAPASSAPARELPYRIYFREVPPERTATSSQLELVMRIGVPVFVAPAKPVTDLRWRAVRKNSEITLHVQNAGNVHARLAKAALVIPGVPPETVGNIPGFRYLLAGESAQWTFPVKGQLLTRRMQVTAETEAGAINADVALDSK